MTTFPQAPDGETYGVDVSTAQGPPTYLPALIEVGARFMFARAHSGKAVDGQWAAMVRAAEEVGMPLGAYGVIRHYGPAGAESQARAFLDAIRGARLALPEVIDWELPATAAELAAMPRAVAAGNIRAARIWRDVVTAETRRPVLVYCGFGFVDALATRAGAGRADDIGRAVDGDLAALAESPLFVAHYTQDRKRLPTVPRPWLERGRTWVLWQSSGDAAVCRNAVQIPGTRRDIDLDVYRGTVEDLIALAGVSANPRQG